MFLPKTLRILRSARLRQVMLLLYTVFTVQSLASAPSAVISAQSSASLAVDPVALIQRAAANEARANEARSGDNQQFFQFKLYKENEKGTTTREVIQTKDGTVTRLLSINGRALTREQEQEELTRLQRLMDDPDLQEHRRRREREDAIRANKLVEMMPLAFLYTYSGMVQGACGPAIKLSFRPNPTFIPPDTESRVAAGIAGEIWIDKAQERMVRLDAKLITDVDFGWGIVGRLYKGGSIVIEDTDVGNKNWQLVHMRLDIAGKALMLRTLTVRLTENSTDFQPIPRQIHFRDAIHLLQVHNTASVQTLNQ